MNSVAMDTAGGVGKRDSKGSCLVDRPSLRTLWIVWQQGMGYSSLRRHLSLTSLKKQIREGSRWQARKQVMRGGACGPSQRKAHSAVDTGAWMLES